MDSIAAMNHKSRNQPKYNAHPDKSNLIQPYFRNENPNVKIYLHTVEYCKKARFPVYKPLKYYYDNEEFSSNVLLKPATFASKPLVLVENIDSFDMARKIHFSINSTNKDHQQVLVLNLASDTKSGGGVQNGARAQEEDLYRKSNYFEANDPKLYPLETSAVIYSPLVHIIKDSSYNLLEEPCGVSCLAVAALRNPKLTTVGRALTYEKQMDRYVMQEKIEMIFKVAIKHGHTNLVLGALGCGVFNNPTEDVALMFKNALEKYAYYFERIGFAILAPAGNHNFNIFHRVIMNV